MRIAVLSLCRDRLDFTRHCFKTLHELAGCEFDHYVLDQASEDGSREWLHAEIDAGRLRHCVWQGNNVGVSRGINQLLEVVVPRGYDVIVKYDNDAELLCEDTLKVAAKVALEGWIISPHIQGLDQTPIVEREEWVAGYRVGVPNIMGGIFMAAPASLYQTYRHDEKNPVWGMDDARIVEHWRAYGGEVGYLLDYPANHYLTTQGQHDAVQWYFDRRVTEGAPP